MNRTTVTHRIGRLLAAVALSTLAAGATAGDDHDRAKTLREAGEILPLQQILQRANKDQAGHVVEVELETKRNTYVYEIKILDADGRVHELYYDAKTAAPVERKSKRKE